MARKLRIEEEGAIYHVINRGNYRRDVFETVGAATAFKETLEETCDLYGWRLHGYVVMRNHYHLAVETPQPNLVEGMHWLQSTFATRFNRFRGERGHLFQGRYQALLVEDAAALTRLVNYIHLNPVRAGVVPAEQVATFRWSSLPRFVKGSRPKWLTAEDVLGHFGWEDTPQNWAKYVDFLVGLASDAAEQARQEFGEMCRGWAIGTAGWRKAIAQEHTHLALSAGVARAELQEIKETRWAECLTQELQRLGKTAENIVGDRKGVPWKLEIAMSLRKQVAAPYRWIARELRMGEVSSVRVLLHRENRKNLTINGLTPLN